MILKLLKGASITILVFVLSHYQGYAQKDQKIWKPDSLLTWADFKGRLDTVSNFDVTSFWNIHYSYQIVTKNEQAFFVFKTQAYFFRDRSWSLTAKQSAPLLAHEQLHLDIAEIFARELLIALNAQNYTEDYKREMQQVFERVFKIAKQTQIRYDEETSHSKNKIRQAQWQLYVSGVLANTSPVH